jgi:hypothetical protein
MKRIILIAVLAILPALSPASSFGSGTAPSAPGAVVRSDLTTKTTLSLALTNPVSCDVDGDFAWHSSTNSFWGFYEFQKNGVFYANLAGNNNDAGWFNCAESWDVPGRSGQTFSGLTCGTSYTLRVRAVDAAGHHGPFRSVGGSQGAKTLPC